MLWHTPKRISVRRAARHIKRAVIKAVATHLSTNSIRNVIEPELWLAGFVCNPSVFRAMRRRMFDTRTGGMAMVVAVVMLSSFVGLLVVARAIPVALVGVRIVVVWL